MCGPDDLCRFCRSRLGPYLSGAIRLDPAELEQLITSFARSCCVRWRGQEPAHWWSAHESVAE